MRWICSCGSVAEDRIEFCPVCLRIHSFFPVVERPTRSRGQGIVKLTGTQLAARASHQVKPGGTWNQVAPEGLQTPAMIVVFGGPGTGKTTNALKMADDWPGQSVVFSFEEGLGPSLAGLVRRLEVTRPTFVSADTWPDVLEAMQDADLVVVDSLQRSATDPGDWRSATVDVGKTLILVSEVNASGEVRGGLAASHLADVVIEMPEFGKFVVRKNRFGACIEGDL